MPSVVEGSRQRLDSRAIPVWAVPVILLELVPGVVTAALLWRAGYALAAGALTALVALAAVWTFDCVRRIWAQWGYVVGMDALEVHHGVLRRRRSVVPYRRVQRLDLERGPLARRLGTTSLVVHTGSTVAVTRLRSIGVAEAERIRVQVMARIGAVADA